MNEKNWAVVIPVRMPNEHVHPKAKGLAAVCGVGVGSMYGVCVHSMAARLSTLKRELGVADWDGRLEHLLMPLILSLDLGQICRDEFAERIADIKAKFVNQAEAE